MADRSYAVDKALVQLGEDLRDARRRRLYSTEDMSSRLGVSRPTLRKMEQGDPNVSMGTYAAALMIFDKLNALRAIFDDDKAATAYLESIKIPKRLRSTANKLRKQVK